MEKSNRILGKRILLGLLSWLIVTTVQAATPLWSFTPLTSVERTLARGETAEIRYSVHNQSSKPKTLLMRAIAGVSQASSCQLPPGGSCTLVLNVNGSALTGDVLGGPVLCQQGNALQCYQPNQASSLRLHLAVQPPVQQFTVTPSAGANGSISPASAQVVNAGSSLTFTATPDTGFGVNQWLLDGNPVQSGGMSFQLNNIRANHSVQVSFGPVTLSALTQELALSVGANNPAFLELTGHPRSIRITNEGSVAATGLQVSAVGFPEGTSIGDNTTCTGTLNAGATCDIIIVPGATASPSINDNTQPCTTAPGTVPAPAVVRVSADSVPPTDIQVFVLGYGCIYQGGHLFSVSDGMPFTGSISGKVVNVRDDDNDPLQLPWGGEGINIGGINENSGPGLDSCLGKSDGACNTQRIVAVLTGQQSIPLEDYAAGWCSHQTIASFDDWYLPAICEMIPFDEEFPDAPPACPEHSANLYANLEASGLGVFAADVSYWSSTEFSPPQAEIQAWTKAGSFAGAWLKNGDRRVRCVRAFGAP